MAHPVNLMVIAGVAKDCTFCLQHDSWNGVREELAVTVRGSSFEDAKRKMEAELQAHIESACVSIPGQVERRLPEDWAADGSARFRLGRRGIKCSEVICDHVRLGSRLADA
jgi:hypothetical protein